MVVVVVVTAAGDLSSCTGAEHEDDDDVGASAKAGDWSGNDGSKASGGNSLIEQPGLPLPLPLPPLPSLLEPRRRQGDGDERLLRMLALLPLPLVVASESL